MASRKTVKKNPNKKTTPAKRCSTFACSITDEILCNNPVCAEDKKLIEAIFHSVIEAIIVADGNGKFILWNTMAEKLIGIGPNNITPDEWASHYGIYTDETCKENFPSDKVPLKRAIKGEIFTDMEVYIKNNEKPKGLWVNVSGRPLRDKQGNHYEGGVIIFRDITDIKKARKAEEYYKNFYNTAPVGFYTTDIKTGQFIKANEFCVKMLGCDSFYELTTLKSRDLYTTKKRRAELIAQITLNDQVTDFEIELKLKDGTKKWAILTACLCENSSCIEGSLTDITDRKKMEIEIEALKKQRHKEFSKLHKDIEKKLAQYR
jgi:PAS domain S-box-containing protein